MNPDMEGRVQACANSKVQLQGGTFKDTVKTYNADDNCLTISGGTYDVVPEEKYVAKDQNLVRVQMNNGKFTVATKTDEMVLDEKTGIYYENGAAQEADNAAKIVKEDGTTAYYKTLEAAVRAAQDGETITMLNDAEGNGIGTYKNPKEGQIKAKSFTIDFNKHTYTIAKAPVGSEGYETQAFHLEWNGSDANHTVTFKNGTITSAADSGVNMLVQNYCDLKLENMTLDGTNLPNKAYVLSNNCGDVTIKDSTINTKENAEQVAFDVYGGFGSYSDVTVTVTGNSVINGDIEVARDDDNDTNKNTLKIENGTVNGAIKVNGDLPENSEINVSGGEFAEKVKPEYLAPDFKYETQNDDDMYTYHKTIQDAQAAAGEGKEVTQVKDAEGKPVEESYLVTVTVDNKNGDATYTLKVDGKINVNDLAVPTRSRYKFRGWTVDGKAVSGEIDVTDNMTIEASWKKKKSSSSSSSSSSDEKTYTVSKADVENGKVKVDPTKAEKGDKVTITVTPDKGYEINKVKVTDADGNKIDLKDKGNGEYTFTMPASKVEVKATFSKAEEKPVEPEDKTIVLTINQLAMSIFGETKINDVAPIIRNDRTMLPIRVVAEALGATVAWNDSLKQVTITKDDLTIEIFIGSPFAKVNGTPVQLDSPAFIENSRTYLPIRFVAENLGADVAWDQTTQQVTITPDK